MSARAEHFDTVRRPVVTEKSTMASASNTVVFEVAPGAGKPAVKAAVEALFNVKVRSVNVVNVKGKRVRFRGRKGRRRDSRKAYVRLEAGHAIDVSAGL